MKALPFLICLWSTLNGVSMVFAWLGSKTWLFVWSVFLQFCLIALAFKVFK